MDGEDLYDEFGNYIGPDLNDVDGEAGSDSDASSSRRRASSSDEDDQSEAVRQSKLLIGGSLMQGMRREDGASPMQDAESDGEYKGGYQVVLHEDKQYYPDADKLYGPGVETLIMDEDAQPLTQPIIEPPKDKSFYL